MQKKPVRIGSFTLGATLAGVGLALLAQNLERTPQGLELWRFWPLLPLLLGVEFLVRQYLLQHQPGAETPLRLDGMAVFISVFILVAGLVYTAVPTNVSAIRSILGLWDGAEYQLSVQRELTDLEGVQRLVIKQSAGKVRIQGTDDSTVTAVASIRAWDATPEAAEALAREVNVSLTGGPVARLTTDGPIAPDGKSRRIAVDYDILLPKNLLTTVKVELGSLTADGITADSLTCSNGDLEATNLRGDVRIVSSRGAVTVRGSEGSLDLDVRQGDLELEGIEGRVTAKNQFGNTTLADVAGPVSIQAEQGNISVHGRTPPAGDWQLFSHFGNIEVALPKDASVTVKAVARYGSLQVPGWLAVENSPGRISASGILGDGKSSLRLETDKGNVDLTAD